MKSAARRLLIAASLVALGIACKEAIVEPVAVARIDVAGGGAGLRLGQSAQLSATLRSEEGWPLPGSGVTWTTSDASVATVSATGQVTALKRGTATVSASAGGVSGTSAVSVIGVQAVSIPQDTLAVVVQAQGTVTATVTADPGVSVPASWVARDTTVAQVDATGRISARKLGTTWVVASAEVAADSVRVVVTPVPVTPPASGAAGPVTTSVLGGAVTLTIPPGATTVPALTVAPAPVAPADDRIPAGLTYVFGPAGSQFTSPITLSVAYDPAQIPSAKRPLLRLHLIEGSTVTEVAGSAVDLVNNRVTAPVSHFSTYAILVPADPSQVAITAGAGQTTFAEYEVPTAPSVTVRDAQGRPVARAKVSFDITAGGGRFRNGATQSSDTATTDASGIATLGARWRLGSSTGANTLAVKVFSAVGATAVTTIVSATAQANPVARVVVSPDTGSVQEGSSQQLIAQVFDARDTLLTERTVTWASSDTGKAVVSTAGLVNVRSYTGPETKSVQITAGSEEKSDVAILAIRPATVAALTLPASLSIVIGETRAISADVRDASGRLLTERAVEWSTSNPAVATVTDNGSVKGVAPGTVTITASREGKSARVDVNVYEQMALGLAAWYPLDGSALDVSGNGNGGELFGSPAFGVDRFGSPGRAMLFDGVDDFVRMSALDSLSFAPITYSAWIYATDLFPENFVGETARVIVGREQACFFNQGSITMHHVPSLGIKNEIGYYRGGDLPRSGYSVEAGKWTHVALTVSENGHHKFYVDGLLVRDTVSIHTEGVPMRFQVGAGTILPIPLCATGSVRPRFLWKGAIDDVKIWTRVLTGSEIFAVAAGNPF